MNRPRWPPLLLLGLALPLAPLPLAVHAMVLPLPQPPPGARQVLARQVDAPTLHRLLSGLEGSLRRSAEGGRPQPLPVHPPASGGGRFFPARGSYLWHRNCNWWIVRRLEDAGLAGPALGVLLPLQVPWRLIGFRPLR
jgi:hypothetical protein